MAAEYSPIDVVTELHQLQVAKVFTALAVFLFDYCLTFSLEVHHVWGRKWEITRIVFTISRYLPFIASPMVCFYNLYGNNCGAYNYVIDVFAQGCVFAAEAILVLRTYALWGHSRRVFIVLIVLAAAFIVAAMVIWSKVKFSLPGDSESAYVWYAAGCGSGALRNTACRGVFLMAYEIGIAPSPSKHEHVEEASNLPRCPKSCIKHAILGWDHVHVLNHPADGGQNGGATGCTAAIHFFVGYRPGGTAECLRLSDLLQP
ncbi:hypothetical protein PAXINDRAFT_165983 [Paxillus involutus ATCC 200175]|nr:hypothetical protein PAXINDRAFT_165983 [Paxillus involutus ATCC 200175]